MITSPFANVYLKVQEQLKTNASLLRWIDHELGQLDHFEVKPPVSMPCALVDIDDGEFAEMGELCETGEVILIVRLGLFSYSASNNIAPDSVLEKALSFYEVEQQVHLALHGFSSSGFSKMIRISRRLEKRNDEMRVVQLRYKFGIEDYTTKPARTEIPRPDPPVIVDTNV